MELLVAHAQAPIEEHLIHPHLNVPVIQDTMIMGSLTVHYVVSCVRPVVMGPLVTPANQDSTIIYQLPRVYSVAILVQLALLEHHALHVQTHPFEH